MNAYGISRALHFDGFFFNKPPVAHEEIDRALAIEMVDLILRTIGIKILWTSGDAMALTKETSHKDTNDSVNHPSHYNAHPSGVEAIAICEHMTFNVGNAIKYLWRAGLKDSAPTVEDLEKAAWYIAREIERVEKKK